MAKFMIMIEDTDPRNPDGPVNISVQQFVPIGEDPRIPTKAGKMTRYVQIKLTELEIAADQDRKQKEGQQGEEAARCWH
jgi:hypothetical protein